MTINREEFKELVGMYKEAFNKTKEYGNILNEEFIDTLVFPALNWIGEKTGLINRNTGLDVLADLYSWGNAPVENDYTDDLDKIYDYYFKEE